MLLPHAQLKILCIAALLPVMLVSLPLDFHGVYSAELPLSDAEKYRKVMSMYRHYRKKLPEIGEIDVVEAIGLLGDSRGGLRRCA